MKGKQFISQTVLHIILFGGALLMILPFFWMIATALKSQAMVYHMPPELFPSHPVLDNFRALFREFDFFTYLKNSIIVSVGYTVGALFMTSMAGYAFSKMKFRGREFLFGFVLITAMIPRTLTLVPNYITLKYLGWLNSYQGLIVPGLANAFNIFFLRQFMKSLPDELLEAAKIDGASELRIYASIILPLCKPALATLAILNFTGMWNEYLWPAIVATDQGKYTLEVGLQTLFSQNSSQLMGTIMAGATIVLVPLLIIFLMGQKYIVKGISLTGIKA